MNKNSFILPAFVIAATIASHGASGQNFKVTKYNIGGDGGTDYVTAEPGTGRVFVSRGTHVMVVDGPTGKVIGDIPDTPRMHGIALASKWKHGFTTNAGDSTVTMFDLKTLGVIRKIKVPTGGLDGIMYEDYSDRIILTNHSRPIGTAVAIDANTGDIVGTAQLEDNAPEGAASDGKGKIFVNNEGKNTIQVIDVKTMKVLASWPLTPCEGPTGIAYDRGNVTVVREESPDKYTVVATVPTMRGAKTITVDPVRHVAYLFQPEYGPTPAAAPGTPPPAAGSRPARGPMIAAWFFAISH